MLLASRRELFFVGEIPGTGCRAPTHGGGSPASKNSFAGCAV